MGGSGEILYCIILRKGVGGWVENPRFSNYVIWECSLTEWGTHLVRVEVVENHIKVADGVARKHLKKYHLLSFTLRSFTLRSFPLL